MLTRVRPCGHTEHDQSCLLCRHLERKRQAADGRRIAVVRARVARVPCVHLGATTGEERPCHGCGNQGKTAAVWTCDRHTLCTPDKGPVDGARQCLTCDDYKPRGVPTFAPFEWISTARLATDATILAGMLPPNVGGVVGLPRSGMIPAAVIATHLHLPLYELTPQGPRRLGGAVPSRAAGAGGGGPLVIVDDTVYHGAAMTRARQLAPAGSLFAAVYVRPDRAGLVNHFARLLPSPHLLEWNLLNNGPLVGKASDPAFGSGVAFDLDGILVHDAESGGRPGLPFMAPRSRAVKLIATGRQERHRRETEALLRRIGVRWERLEMLPDREPETPDAMARHKARHYMASGCGFFVESDPWQARRIWTLSGRPVVCPIEQKVYQPGQPWDAADFVTVRSPIEGWPEVETVGERAVVTVVVGERAEAFFRHTEGPMRRYAERVGAQLVVCHWPGNPDWPMSRKYGVRAVIRGCKRIIYADADVLFQDDSPDLFAMVPEDRFAAVDEWPHHVARPARRFALEYRAFRELWGVSPALPPRYVNAGLFVASRQHAHLLDVPERPIPPLHAAEQHLLNVRLFDGKVPFWPLPRSANWQHWTDPGFKTAPAGSILHFSGAEPGDVRRFA